MSESKFSTPPTPFTEIWGFEINLYSTPPGQDTPKNNVVQKLGLQPSGKTSMSGSTGSSTVDQYTFGVGFFFPAHQTLTGTISGQLNLHMVQGCEFTHHRFGFDVLIGRDILCKGSLSLSFDGHYLLSF